MALDPVPWIIGGGAEHSPAVARTLAYMATNGATGIGLPGDLRVTQLPTPGGYVRVGVGAVSIASPYAGQQSYIARNSTATDVAVSATGSGGGSTRYVIIEITDPEYAGTVVDPKLGPYVKFRLVTTTSGITTPFVTLAKITQPANTTAITSAMIKDMREVANPRERSVVIARPGKTGDAGMNLNSKTAYPAGEWFPNFGGPTNNGYHTISVPYWATQMEIRAEWLGVRYAPQAGWGDYWVAFGPDAGVPSPSRVTQAFSWDADETANIYRTNWILHDTQSIPAAWRGDDIGFVLRASRKNTTSQNGMVSVDTLSGVTLSVRFLERADE